MKFGMWELLIILGLVLLVFGTKRLRNAGGDIGAAIKGFKKEIGDSELQTKEEQTKKESSSEDN